MRTKKKKVDFKDQMGVYALYDEAKSIVYIGQTGTGKGDKNRGLLVRLREHMDDHLWNRWQYFSWVGFKEVNQDGTLSIQQKLGGQVQKITYATALNEIEGILIEIIEPKLNLQSGKLPKNIEYFQCDKPETSLEDIKGQIDGIKALISNKKQRQKKEKNGK